jgi:hypothetical protein
LEKHLNYNHTRGSGYEMPQEARYGKVRSLILS